MANEDKYDLAGSYQNIFTQWHGSSSGETQIGNLIGQAPPASFNDTAYRFPNIAISQGASIDYAQLRMYAGAQGSATMHLKTYGIKETNTATFSSNPFGRTQTSAVSTTNNGMPGVGAFIGIDVKSQVNEILAQGGWSSGNAMGFLVFDNTSDLDGWIEDDFLRAQLIIRINAVGNFLPSPLSVGAPTFPTAQDYGISIAMNGYDVRTATESQLVFTSRKKEFKILTEGEITAVANITQTIAHNLGYYPASLAYVEGGGFRFKLNRDFLGATDPVGNGVEGFIGSDSSNLQITVTKSNSVYYYIFIDPLAES